MYAEGSNVCSGFTAHPEDSQMALIVEFIELAFVDSSDTELSLDGGDQGRSLEQRAGQSLERSRELCFTTG